jgi:hypothetical protein
MPPIAQAIFNKISNCGIFVPDLSFVGSTPNNRKIPNPNVLIEYGWALKEVGYSRIVPIMNTAFGGPDSDDLPFDMRHLRNPIQYSLQLDHSADQKAEEKGKLIKKLITALNTILESGVLELKKQEDTYVFPETHPTISPSTFFDSDEEVGDIGRWNTGNDPLVIPETQHLFLRLIPTYPVESFRSAKAATDAVREGGLRPFVSRSSGWSPGRNKYGGFVADHNNNRINGISQLFKNKELWGIDTLSIDEERLRSWSSVDFGYIPSGAFESLYAEMLGNFLAFAKNTLLLPPPLKFVAGMTNVRGYKMALPSGFFDKFGGEIMEDHIIYTDLVPDLEVDPATFLRPFFEYVWEELGLDRPDID